MQKAITDAITGITEFIYLSPEEIAQREATEKELEPETKKLIAEAEAKEQAEAEKQAKIELAKAKLTALGLDEAEVQAILGL